MVAIIDAFNEQKKLPSKDRIVAVARWFYGTPYKLGAKSATPLAGTAGTKISPTDCSGFICAVFNEVFGQKLNSSATGTAQLITTPLFKTVITPPQEGDIICWSGHAAIVVDANSKRCIHAPGAGKPLRYEHWPYISKNEKPVFRRWHTL